MRSRARNKARIAVLDARVQTLIDALPAYERAELHVYCERELAAYPSSCTCEDRPCCGC